MLRLMKSYSYIIIFTVLSCWFSTPAAVAAPVPQNDKKVEMVNHLLEKVDSCLRIQAEESLTYIQEAYRIIGRSKKYEALRLQLRYYEALSYAYHKNPDFDKAEKLFISLQSECPSINYLVGPELGTVYIAKEQYEDAIRVLEDCIASVPSQYRDAEWETRTSAILALSYIYNGQKDKASELLYPLLEPSNSIYTDYSHFKRNVSFLYYKFVEDGNGNIIWFDKIGLEMLRLLCEFTKEENDSAWHVYFTMKHGEMSKILGDFKTALTDFQYCIDNYSSALNILQTPIASLYMECAGVMSRLGRFTEAHELLNIAKRMVDEIDDQVWKDWAENHLKFERAILYIDEGINTDAAASILEELLDNYPTDDSQKAIFIYNLALAYADIDINKAILAYKEALRLYEKTEGHSVLYAKTISRLGRAMINIGDHSSAIKYFELSIDIFRRLNPEGYSYILTLSDAAQGAFRMKQYGRSISWAEEARRIQNKTKNYTSIQAWRTLLSNYNHIGDKRKYDLIYEEYQQIPKRDSFQYILFIISEINKRFKEGRVEAAQDLIPTLDSLSRQLSVKNYSSLGGKIEKCKNQFIPGKRTMFDYYSTVLSQSDESGDFVDDVLVDMGNDEFNKGNFTSANFLLKLGYNQYYKDNTEYLYKGFLSAHKCGDFNSCDRLKRDMTNVVRQQMKSVIGLTGAEKESYWQDIIEIQNLLLCYREDDSSDDLLYDFLLSSKSFLLRSDLTLSSVLQESNDLKLIELGQALKATRRIISDGKYSLAPEVVDSLRLREIELNREIASKIKDFSVFDSYGKYTFVDVLNSLKDNEVAIEFINYPCLDGSVEYAALICKKGLSKPLFVKLCKEDELIDIIKVEPKKLYNKDLPFSTELFKKIWGPIWSHLTTNGKVYISATGYLNIIALEALVSPSGLYVEEEIFINRLTSTAELCSNKDKEAMKQATLFGGIQYDNHTPISSTGEMIYSDQGYLLDRSSEQVIDYLPATKIEAESIARLLCKKRMNTSLFIGQDGTEEEFKRLSGSNVSILHIANHGFYKPKDKTRRIGYFDSFKEEITPLQRSGLLLAGCSDAWNGNSTIGREDGVLTASEISELDLSSTQLVVISACESGLGEITDDGVSGLQRAFKNAGVQTIVMSLWKVDDKATELLMTYFYKSITEGKSYNDAFNEAKRHLKNSKKYSNPYYWASFIILD